MILSDIDIIHYVELGKISISGFQEDMVYPASYAFRLGEFLLRHKTCGIVDFEKKLIPDYEEIKLTDEGYILKPGELILGQTAEKITLCSELAMIIEGRSSLARVGVEVIQESSFVEPDHTQSIITLEIKNNGPHDVVLRKGMKFAKGIFIKLTSPATGKYRKSSYSSIKRQDKVLPAGDAKVTEAE